MKIYVMTDLECTAGVVSLPEYCLPGPSNKYGRAEAGKYYEHSRELATMEVNAAMEGLLEGGATEILVRDGHGPGGLDVSLLRPEASMLTGGGSKPPHFMDESFDAALMLGQHAKAHTDGGHLAHSGSFFREDWLVNGRSVGEIALFMQTASTFRIPVVMISGDVAACAEAREHVPSIETVAVIEGQKLGSTRGMTVQQAIDFNVAAVHLSPVKARQKIREGARRCLARIDTVERFTIDAPYEMVRINRRTEEGPGMVAVARADDWVELLARPIEYQPAGSVKFASSSE